MGKQRNAGSPAKSPWLLVLLLVGYTCCWSPVQAFSPLTSSSGTFVPSRQKKSRIPRQQSSLSSTTTSSTIEIENLVGSGSYGTVHLVSLDGTTMIGKRAWNENDDALQKEVDPKERAQRCRYYFKVEQHCFEKMTKSSEQKHVPNYKGVFEDADGREWMVFELLTTAGGTTPARTLEDVMKMDWSDQHQQQQDHHHLFLLQEEMGLDADATFSDVLDAVLSSLLQGLAQVHDFGIVHRDVKPGNLLCNADTQSLVFIDFGSAADMEPIASTFFGMKKTRVGIENENRVALSPVYSAPEVFVQPERAPHAFDVFSAGLVFCQLLFNYLDERTDAAFHQQLEDASFDLDTWLSRELSSKVRPGGLEDALAYLAERPGLWKLLGDMLKQDPEQRVLSRDAAKLFQDIVAEKDDDESVSLLQDGSFFESVVLAMETCEIPQLISDATATPPPPRPLHFVATFERKLSLGLILSEVTNDDNDDEELDPDDQRKWLEATKDSRPGEVFVRGIVPYGQADQMDIFEIGDRLQGVGELPLAEGGFEQVLEMLERQPQWAKNVKLHFDRQSVLPNEQETEATAAAPHLVRVVGQGAWSVKGRRKAQEDAFVLHEIHKPNQETVLVAGVFDGHAGTAASKTASELLPNLLHQENSLADAWDTTCTTYRGGCQESAEICLATYDKREGMLEANTGSDTIAAGTTAAVATIASSPYISDMSVLNCGDSRTILVGSCQKSKSVVLFATRDHSPSDELEAQRLQSGRNDGLDYSLPECSLSKWWLSVGDYQYAVSRSLEGSFATKKGIVSDADVSTLEVSKLLQDCQDGGAIVIASDGLFEVMDNELVGRKVIAMRRDQQASAGDAAKALCGLALEKGTTDNVSVVVVYLE